LVCPCDRATKASVLDWTTRTNGLAHPANQSQALSYFVGLDAYEQYPVTFVAGDRNLVGGRAGHCDSVSPHPGVDAVNLHPNNLAIAWTNGIHTFQGNMAISDGSVQKTRRAGLKDLVYDAYTTLHSGAIRTASGERPDNHILLPR
jgi:hypothetical protein